MIDRRSSEAEVVPFDSPWLVGVYGPLAREVGMELERIDRGRRIEVIGDEKEFAEALTSLEALILSYAPAPPRDYWQQAARLRLIQLVGAGADQLLPAPGLSPTVKVANVRFIQTEVMGEFILALLLSLVKQLPRAMAEQRSVRWTKYVPTPVRGRTLGILGLGAVGQEVASRATGLGMRVIGVKRHPCELAGVARVYSPDRIDEMIEAADDLVVLLPLTPETAGLLSRERLALLRPTSTVTVASRGGIVDEEAILDMLREGNLMGAAFDAFAVEPPGADSGFWTEPNAIVTPHVSSAMPGYPGRVAEVFLENERLLRRGQPLVSEVIVERGY